MLLKCLFQKWRIFQRYKPLLFMNGLDHRSDDRLLILGQRWEIDVVEKRLKGLTLLIVQQVQFDVVVEFGSASVFLIGADGFEAVQAFAGTWSAGNEVKHGTVPCSPVVILADC